MSGKTCTDTGGVTYGILCATRFSGIVITNSGKKFLLERDEDFEQIEAEMRGGREKRDYTGTFDNCAGFCDTYDKASCGGVGFQGGYCMAYDTVTGTFSSGNGVAALRQ
ncbi:hypothetical protein LTR36_010343 [Oleoguttula mirabilis]|uniref:Uncharacterized protein n=1 Tax=Oleoguttula mirabilis TaxID=1507867 RepID=A0AAV9J5A2_9PEZI|nr:hypothetical protein LTR36_010343 [Oleoguttula mirabilis]